MQVTRVSAPSLSDDVVARVDADIDKAFQSIVTQDGQFIVNETPWFFKSAKGKISPRAVNEAGYISSGFQRGLADLGWKCEKKLDDQKIDAYLELETAPTPVFRIEEKHFIDFFAAYVRVPRNSSTPGSGEALDGAFSRLYQSMVKRASPVQRADFDPSLQHFLLEQGCSRQIRIGLEFETGNIASSFRAISKLSYLYLQNCIDAGVFITSIDKARCACRIWPVRNRNGSFEELRRRNYKSALILPLWEYGFAPDGFSRSAPYLGVGKNAAPALYVPQRTNKSEKIAGVTYEVWIGNDSKELLQPINSGGYELPL